jgi:hypothetical protein
VRVKPRLAKCTRATKNIISLDTGTYKKYRTITMKNVALDTGTHRIFTEFRPIGSRQSYLRYNIYYNIAM